MTTWDDLEFQRDLDQLSEIPLPADIEPVPVPRVIEEYNERILANRTGSIFDNPDDILADELNDGNDVTYVISGRGRGGKNTYYKPGGLITGRVVKENEAQVQQELREIAGLGYSNQLIMETLRRKQAQNSSSSSTTSESSHTPQQPSSRTHSSLEMSDGLNHFGADSPSSNSFVSAERTNDSATSTEDEIFHDCSSLQPSTSIKLNNGFTRISPVRQIEKCDKPKQTMPLSQMLKLGRQNKRLNTTTANASNGNTDRQTHALASSSNENVRRNAEHGRLNSEDISRGAESVRKGTRNGSTDTQNDWRDTQNRRKDAQNCRRDTGAIENRNRGNALSWRRRGPDLSPPRFPWGAAETTKSLDIDSSDEFPPLK